MCSQAKDIVSLRLSHCRAERAAQQRQYHLAALHYRHCLETAELREDCQAVRFLRCAWPTAMSRWNSPPRRRLSAIWRVNRALPNSAATPGARVTVPLAHQSPESALAAGILGRPL
ncbi:hypothetical protein [Deinococcus radiophilus]|uniref:hypothetical protein n=1 Tax=Deinococcus radiophilus TaxID=32062 RepID=UPI0036D277E6